MRECKTSMTHYAECENHVFWGLSDVVVGGDVLDKVAGAAFVVDAAAVMAQSIAYNEPLHL